MSRYECKRPLLVYMLMWILFTFFFGMYAVDLVVPMPLSSILVSVMLLAVAVIILFWFGLDIMLLGRTEVAQKAEVRWSLKAFTYTVGLAFVLLGINATKVIPLSSSVSLTIAGLFIVIVLYFWYFQGVRRFFNLQKGD